MLEANLRVTRAVPDRCSGVLSSGVAKRSRLGDSDALARLGASNETSSRSCSMVVFLSFVVESEPTELPPAEG